MINLILKIDFLIILDIIKGHYPLRYELKYKCKIITWCLEFSFYLSKIIYLFI